MAVTLTSIGVLYNDTTTITNSVTATRAIFGYGGNIDSTTLSLTNLVNNYGGVAQDISGVGTARMNLAAAGYGGDRVIFGYGRTGNGFGIPFSYYNVTNLVSNLGVVSADVTGVGTARAGLAAAGYGGDKAIFVFGDSGTLETRNLTNVSNLVSNTGVVSADVAGVGTARWNLAATNYGGDKAIFGYGATTNLTSITSLVSNTGVVSADVTGVGTARTGLAAAGYGGDKAIFGYGYSNTWLNLTNLVSNTGVVSADVTGVGTARYYLAAAGYGGDKAIFGYGGINFNNSITNLVSNTGVVSADVTGVGTARSALAAASYSS